MPPTSECKVRFYSSSSRLISPQFPVLFTTVAFICLFLPVVLAGFFLIARFNHAAAAFWLFAASVFFYGYWMPEFTLLLLASITGNFLIGAKIASLADIAGHQKGLNSKRWLFLGVSANLLLLSYFKYANFFIDNMNLALGSQWDFGRVILPIGISFFTFTQIAYLVDTWRKGLREYRFVHYGLFVTYFPHLIAGPVLHHSQMMPQFRDAKNYQFNFGNFSAGIVIFSMGLFKKIVLADGISPYADTVFKAADSAISPDFFEAWLGAIAYTFQLYFDFSGYSDMAIGLSWMFNIRLPFNFNSPYKATSIGEFWRRWHISLSQFLRDYLYIALGGNRNGVSSRHINLMLTMVLGGLWHGASWSFILWGFLHGMYLCISHGFRALCSTSVRVFLDASRVFSMASWLLTMIAVVVAWVLFRTETLPGAGLMLRSMATPNMDIQFHTLLWNAGLSPTTGWMWCGTLAAIAFLSPNTNQLGNQLLQVCRSRPSACAMLCGAGVGAVAFMGVLNLMRDTVSAFIYFNF